MSAPPTSKVVTERLIQGLLERRIAASTLAPNDVDSATELLDGSATTWRLGPALEAGDFLLIYWPKGLGKMKGLEDVASGLRYLYRVESETVELGDESSRRHEVALGERLELEPPIDPKHPELASWGLAKRNFRGAGRQRESIGRDIARVLWRLVIESSPGAAEFLSESAPSAAGDARSVEEILSGRPETMRAQAARALAKGSTWTARRPDIPIELAVVAFLLEEAPDDQRNTAAFIRSSLRSGEKRRARARAPLALGLADTPEFDEIARSEGAGEIDASLVSTLVGAAEEIRVRTSPDTVLHTRHLLVAALVSDPVRTSLEGVDHDVASLLAALLDFLRDQHPGDVMAEWERLLTNGPTDDTLDFRLRTAALRDTWTEHDELGYAVYAQAIADSIRLRTTKPPLAVGIQAPWGQGKTSLMWMIRRLLDPYAPGGERRPEESVTSAVTETAKGTYGRLLDLLDGKAKTVGDRGMLEPADGVIPSVWFNPLYYRASEQVWAGLAHAILHQLSERLEPDGSREEFWFRLHAARINVSAVREDLTRSLFTRFLPWAVVELLMGLIGTVGGMLVNPWWVTLLPGSWVFAYLHFRYFRKNQGRNLALDEAFAKYVREPNYDDRLGLLHLVDHDIDRMLGILTAHRPIAVFIDDLDRCDPDTVSEVILAVNQFLSLPERSVFFFLGMDMEMVSNALERSHWSSESDNGDDSVERSIGWRFMEKFVQLPFAIPHLDPETARSFARLRLQDAANSKGDESVQEDDDSTESEGVDDAVAGIESAESAEEVAARTNEALASFDSRRARAKIEAAASTRVTETLEDPSGDEMKKIVDLALRDLELNPRTIKRYFGLVRILRNIQISTGHSKDADTDRLLVLRAAHLLMNWPEFIQWIGTAPYVETADGERRSSVAELGRMADSCETPLEWSESIDTLHAPPAHRVMHDPELFRYLKRLEAAPPSLEQLYERRMF
ncbi:MAG: P-loop NTPase fold protein [Planctomycetota bacterium]